MRLTFGPTREEGTDGWRKLHNEEPYSLNSSSITVLADQIKMHVTSVGEIRNAFTISVTKCQEVDYFGD
jgi:hypothetical protein